MTPRRASLSVFVLTEDSAANAHETLVALLKRTFTLICPGVGTHLVAFEPADPEARLAVQANAWKSRRPADHKAVVKLHRTIARKLVEQAEVPAVIIFHVDGDRVWAERKRSENAEKLGALITCVQQLVAGNLAGKSRGQDVGRAMARLLVWMPFYSIEAWLFQNHEEARRLCHATGCGRHDETLAEWAQDRGALDEVEKPKEALCFRDRHNLVLAKRFPAEEVRAAGKSYATVVAALESCPGLADALAHTLA